MFGFGELFHSLEEILGCCSSRCSTVGVTHHVVDYVIISWCHVGSNEAKNENTSGASYSSNGENSEDGSKE